MTSPRIAYILDPRFPGGTSSAVAAELDVIHQHGRIVLHAQSTAMFKGTTIAPQLYEVIQRLDIPVVWDAPEIAADIAILHNPSCLRFQDQLNTRVIAHHLIVVAHENFLRPGGAQAFDVRKCMRQIEVSALAVSRTLAPISDWNRQTIIDWTAAHGGLQGWSLLDADWFNICDFDLLAPASQPRDRRGRLSRPGLEKFPSREVLQTCFPPSAECNVILGADALIMEQDAPLHWQLLAFRSMPVDRFLGMIDFMVYFTAPSFRESFGRVMAEAVAAGKIVISDPDTARNFDGAVLGAAPADVDTIIAGYIAKPERYRADVQRAQSKLQSFSPQAFADRILPVLSGSVGIAA
jgi:hypothetical protein